MPKIVDPIQRRKAVADAVFRVVAEEGVQGASLRRVAEEAGLAIGSVRHYFDGHTELLGFALAELNNRVNLRVEAHLARRDTETRPRPGHFAEQVLAELLPLDPPRLEEAAVWLAFTATARSHPALAPIALELASGVRWIAHRALTGMAEAGVLNDTIGDLEHESDRLAALLDGLALAAVIDPGRRDPDTIRAVLRLHLASLVRNG
ncbi:TetR family transcriptional regulator [Nocardia panacis]|uniref:TetR family transcriptional regulator n=1 Tax=Nocardia panacis TaxID=2340916 RepID=A0A3A4K8R2_9NOCA|nr:TetR/AcrR family transcriptional regulator [Nocardia panacis]RJO74089.1 TetR family transcriptional regulator [Nocardia panacis]